jgi:membrane fusion protein (multidrug efflux system)
MMISKRILWNASLITLISVMILACSQGNDNLARLQKLRQQREKYLDKVKILDDSIDKLRQALIAAGDTTEGIGRRQNIRVETVVPGLFRHYIQVQGTVESDKDIFVPAQSPGIVEKIYVNEGDHVRKDQVMAQLDASLLEKSIEEIKVNLDLAKTVYERQKRLWDQKIGSEIQYLQAKNAYENLESRLATTMEQYDKTKIKSPIDGVVDKIAIKEGETAAAGFGAIRVVQKSDLKIKSQISEKYIENLHVGDTAFIRIPGLDLEFRQTLNAVSNVIDADTRTFGIEILVPKEYSNIANNMLVVINIMDYLNQEAITVPVNVVQNSGNEEFLFVAVKDGNYWKASKRIVTTGRYYDDQVEITYNLSPGDKVVTVGYQDLADGQYVNIVD